MNFYSVICIFMKINYLSYLVIVRTATLFLKNEAQKNIKKSVDTKTVIT